MADKEKSEKNEFEDIDDEKAPEATFSEEGGTEQDDILASGSGGVVYDYHKAPDFGKAPPRKDLDGQVLIIKKADIIIPEDMSGEWDKSQDKKTEYKSCRFAITYDKDGQVEYYSGVRVFKRVENGKTKCSHPSIMRDRKNQSSKLMGLYADFKGKDINEVSLREFMSFLNGQPKAKIKAEDFKNPTTGKNVKKNMIGEFIK